MKRVALVVITLLAALTMASHAVAQIDCATVEDCAAVAAAAKARGNVLAQQTAEARRATAEAIATERAEARRATAVAFSMEATQTAEAAPTVTPFPSSTALPTQTPQPTATPLPTATARPGPLDRIVDRLLAQPTQTPSPEGSAEPKTPVSTYLVWALLALFVVVMLKVIFGQVTTVLPPEPPQTWRNDDEFDQ